MRWLFMFHLAWKTRVLWWKSNEINCRLDGASRHFPAFQSHYNTNLTPTPPKPLRVALVSDYPYQSRITRWSLPDYRQLAVALNSVPENAAGARKTNARLAGLPYWRASDTAYLFDYSSAWWRHWTTIRQFTFLIMDIRSSSNIYILVLKYSIL